MTPERWQQIDRLFHSALLRDSAERTSFLAQACAGDESLRLEVASLLGAHDQSDSFIEEPAADIAAELLAGKGHELRTGLFIGPYRVLSLLGKGAMGEVYLAEDSKLGRQVALKRLPFRFTLDEERVVRFQQEARAAARLDHPNICPIFEIAEADDRNYIVMQYVEGENLGSLLARHTLRLGEAIDIACQVADALAEAHTQGIVHRDIKPQNIMVNPRGQVKVLDFGLAKCFDAPDRVPAGQQTETILSAPGLIVGTAPYMSPEQAKGSKVDERSDLFSLGAMLYECVTGRPPFTGESAMEIRAQVIHLHPPAPSLLNPAVSPDLAAIILKAMAKDPKGRYQSAADFRKALRVVRESAPLELHAETAWASPAGYVPGSSVLSNVSQALKRPRVFVPALSLIGALSAILIIAPGWRGGPGVPSSEAIQWFEAGTNAMRNGSYFQASKALRHAVELDEEFALAHARLADAYAELDYADQASQEILRAQALARNVSAPPQLDALYLKALTQTALREDAAAVASYQEIARVVPDSARPSALVDLGRAYERHEELEKAQESYQEAIRLAPSNAGARLRLGGICGRRQDFDGAEEAFRNAEKLYQDLGDFEGLTEVLYQRGLLLKTSDKTHEARAQLGGALKRAEDTGSIYQQVRALLALSSVAAAEGYTSDAEQNANQAISLAQANQIENQATSGLILLGNAFLLRGDYEAAEKHYQQGLLFAQRDHGHHNEALARVQLGSLRMQQRRTDEALLYIEQAMPFFRQAGYRAELSAVLTLRGRGYRNKGDYEAALNVFKEQLQFGEQSGEASQTALAHKEIGSVLAGREDFAQALMHFDKSYELNKSLGAELNVSYAAMHRAGVLWQIGRYQEARSALAEALRGTRRPEGDYKHLAASVHLVRSLLEASGWHFREARAESQLALSLAGTQYKPTIIQAKTTLALLKTRTAPAAGGSAAQRAGLVITDGALVLARDTGDPQLLANTMLTAAEVLLANGADQRALEMALQAQQSFWSSGQLDSEWRAWLLAARASQHQGEAIKAREYASRASERQAALEQRLGAAAYRGYRSRPDVQHYNKQLAQIVTQKG